MRPNAWVGLAAVVLGVLYGIQAWHLPKALIGNPWAPVYFPLGLGILMTALGALLLFLEARKGLTNLEGAKVPRFDRRSLGLIGAVAGLCLLYTLLFERIGFIPSTLIFLMGMLSVVNGPKRWMANGLITLGFTFGAWYSFVRVFQINLP